MIKQRMPTLTANGWVVDSIFRYDFGGRDELLRAGVSTVEIDDRFFIEEALNMVSCETYDSVVIFDVPELVHPLRDVFSNSLIYEVHTSRPENLRGGPEPYAADAAADPRGASAGQRKWHS